MSKKKNNSKKFDPKKDLPPELTQPWIKMNTAMKVITLTSIAMAVLTAWQVIPARGWLEGILWGLAFGAMIWAIFFGMMWVNRLLRR